jgi:hypothetical protein
MPKIRVYGCFMDVSLVDKPLNKQSYGSCCCDLKNYVMNPVEAVSIIETA